MFTLWISGSTVIAVGLDARCARRVKRHRRRWRRARRRPDRPRRASRRVEISSLTGLLACDGACWRWPVSRPGRAGWGRLAPCTAGSMVNQCICGMVILRRRPRRDTTGADCQNARHAQRSPHRGANGEPSPYVELDRDAWAALGEQFDQPLSAEEVSRLRGLGDELDLDEVRQVYLPLSRLLSLRVEGRATAPPQAGGVPPPAAAAAHAVRDRARRLGRGRQVDDRARAPADAGALGRAPARRAGDDRRLPAPQRRARAPGSPAAQGVPRVLRPPGAAAVRGRHQVRQGRGRGPDVLPPRVRRGARREGRRPPPRHRDPRGSQRPPARAGHRRRPRRPGAERLLRLRHLRRRGHHRHPAVVRRPVPAAASRPPSPTRRRTSVATPPCPPRRRPRPPRTSGTPSTVPTSSRTSSRPGPGPPWSCARPGTTRCSTCDCASSEDPLSAGPSRS